MQEEGAGVGAEWRKASTAEVIQLVLQPLGSKNKISFFIKKSFNFI